MDNYCRTCMRDSNRFSPIFEEMTYGGIALQEAIADVCQLEVSIGDRLSVYVCRDCALKLYDIVKFKMEAHEVDCTLRKLMVTHPQIKLETEETREDECMNVLPIKTENIQHVEESVNHSIEVSAAPVCLPCAEVTNPEGGSANHESPGADINIGSCREMESYEEYIESEINHTRDEEIFPEEEEDDMPQLRIEDSDTEGDMVDEVSRVSDYCTSMEECYSKSAQCIQKHSWEDVENVRRSNREGMFGIRNLEICEMPERIQKESKVEVSKESAEIAYRNSDNTNEYGKECGIEVVHSYKGRLRRKRSNINENVTDQCPKSNNGGGRRKISNESDCKKKPSIESIVSTSLKQEVHKSDKKTVDKPLETSKGINSHENKSEGEAVKRFFCDMCRRGFCSKFNLRVHVWIHIGFKPYKCSICCKAFVRKYSLLQHNSVHVIDRPHLCRECGKSFKDVQSLQKHKKTHGNHISHPCLTCGKCFVDVTQLQKHLKVHGIIKPFSCQTCRKYFSSGRSLREHKLIHTDYKPYSCGVCNMSFRSKSCLKTHFYRHTNLVRHMCSKCDKGFAFKSELKCHMQSHLPERPFQCPKCNVCFKRKSNLKRHLKFSCNGM